MNRLTLGYYFAIAAVWCIVSAIEDLRDDMHMRTTLLRDERMTHDDEHVIAARDEAHDGAH